MNLSHPLQVDFPKWTSTHFYGNETIGQRMTSSEQPSQDDVFI